MVMEKDALVQFMTGKSSIQIQQELGPEALHEMKENVEEHERVRLLEQLAEYRVTQRHGVPKTNQAQAADVLQNLEKVQNEFDALFSRTGTHTMMFAVRSDTHDPNEPMFIETRGSREFLSSYFDKSYQEIGHNYELWSVAKGRGELKTNSIVSVRSEINREVHAKLRIVTGKKDAKMSWSKYEIDICEALKVKIVGWLVTQMDKDGTDTTKMGPLNQLPVEIARLTLKGLKNGTIFFVKMSKTEHDALVAKHDALRAANGPLKRRAQRSDFGKMHASRKRKAGEGEDEEDEDEDEDEDEGYSAGGSGEGRMAQKKRRTDQAASAGNTRTAMNAPTPNAASASIRSSASSTPNASTASDTSDTPSTSNMQNAPKKKASKGKGKKKATGAGSSARPAPRAHRRSNPAPPATAAPATSTPPLNNPAPTLRLPSPEPSHTPRMSGAMPMATTVDSGPSPEARAFGAPASDAWGLAQILEFSDDLMNLLGEAVNNPLWGSGAGTVPYSAQGQPLQSFNMHSSALPPVATPANSQAAKHIHRNMAEMWGENMPPSAAGAAPTSSASGPSPASPAPYLSTRFRL